MKRIRIRIQRTLCCLLAVGMMLTVAACGEPTENPKTSTGVSEDQVQASLTDSAAQTGTEDDSATDLSPSDRTSTASTDSGAETDVTSDGDTDAPTPTDGAPSTGNTSSSSSRPTDSGPARPSTSTASASTSTGTTPSTQTGTFDPPTEPRDETPSGPVNTDISPIQPKDYYGRKWLSRQTNGSALTAVYDALTAGCGARKDRIEFSSKITVSEFYTVWSCYRADYPQHFWLGSQYRYSYDGSNRVVAVEPDYQMSEGQLSSAKSAFEAAAKSILRDIHSGMTQYEIEKTIHDQLILKVEYELSDHPFDAYGALVEGEAVCEGFARAFQYLCRSVGIETLFVYGSSENPTTGKSENHAWNIVKIDGEYYHVDATWDNTGEPKAGRIHYAWFNLPTSRIVEDHTILQEGYAYPLCTATAANYFTRVKGEIPNLTVENLLKNTVKQGNEYFAQVYLLSNEDAVQWMNVNAGALAKAYGLNGYSYNVFTTGREACITMSKYAG